MNAAVANLAHLYETAADLKRSEQEFQDTLGLLENLAKSAKPPEGSASLLQLAERIGYVGGQRLSAVRLRNALRDKIFNRRAAAIRASIVLR